MNYTEYYNPEFDFLVNELHLPKTNDSLLAMNYHQIKKFYEHYNLKDLTYENINTDVSKIILNVIYKYKKFHSNKSEKKTWFLNIKHTYELLSQIPDIENKKFTIYFEYKLNNHRIDTLLRFNDSFFMIEYSHLKTGESINKKIQEKQSQLELYNLLFYSFFNKQTSSDIYLDNYQATIDNTLNSLLDFFK